MGAQRAAQHPTPASGPQHPRGPALPQPQAQRRRRTHPTLLCSRRTCWTEGWSSTCCLWGAGGQPTAAGPRSRPTRFCAPSTHEQGCPRPCQSRREPWKGAAAGTGVLSGSTASPQVPSGPQHCVPTSEPGGCGAVGPRQRRVPGTPPSVPPRKSALGAFEAGTAHHSDRLPVKAWPQQEEGRGALGKAAGQAGPAGADEAVGGCRGDSGAARDLRDRSWGCAGPACVSGERLGPLCRGRASRRVRLGSVGARGRFCPRPLLRSGAVAQAAAGSCLSGLIRGLLLRAVTLHEAPVGLSLTFLLWLLVHDELVVEI